MRTEHLRCNEGPFCSRKCAYEHFEKAPHYREI